MKFIKALQKSDAQGQSSRRVKKPGKKSADVASLDAKVPDFLSDENVKIGKPSVQRIVETSNSETTGSVGTVNLNGGTAGTSTSKTFREVSVDPQSVNQCLVAITQPNSGYAEEYRNLRTTVLQKSKKQRLRSIVVASVAPGEGKSITALNLAWLMAQTEGVTALVVDADLHLPSLSKYVGIKSEVGLSNVLDGEIALHDAIIKLAPAGLHLLPGGRVRHDVAELLSGPTFARIIEDASSIFDYVIIDAPPLGVFSDAKILINNTDGALIVIRSNYTHYKTLGRIIEDLPTDRLLGVVLNDSEETIIEGDYYYDYRYPQP